MNEMNFFQSMDHLEPKCGNCDEVLQYGTNTKFDDTLKVHLCLKCGARIS